MNLVKITSAIVALSAFISISAKAQYNEVAYDNANTGGYPANDGSWPSINGGFGYGAWTPLSDTSGGGTYMEGIGTNHRQVDSNYSFALYAGSGSYDISRPLSSSLTNGEFSIITRFDVNGTANSLVNIRAGNNTSSFGTGELLSFGVAGASNPQLDYTDKTGFHTISSGGALGDVWDWTVAFNTLAGTYSLSVTNLGGGFATMFSGTLESNGSSVGSFAVINQDSGSNQNVIFDSPEFLQAVPEPATLALFGISGLTLLAFRRRK